MHIPDGFLSNVVSIIGWILTIALIAIALRQTRNQLGDRQIPLMGILAAFVFAAQMINFPVTGGTSGHLLGGALVAILLGPWAAVLVMTAVIGVQALMFQDGGLIVLGFNIFNMGIVSAFVGYTTYNLVKRVLGNTKAGNLVGTGIGAWLGVVVASAVTALELAVSGTSPLNIGLPAMVGIHLLIGIGEALISVAAVAFIRQTRPDLIGNSTKLATSGSGWIAVGLMIAIAIAFASPLASQHPDGLDSVAQEQGFAELAQDNPYQIMPDYSVPFIDNELLTTIAAGVIGVLVVAGIGYGVAKVSNNGKSKDALDSASRS
jgi:cobalt/nickel transport system permease protein